MESTGDLYNRNFGGKLKLKRLKVKGIRPDKKIGSESKRDDSKEKPNDAKEITGTGRIVSSGNTIQGFETKFVEEVAVGDTIIVKHPISKDNEARTVQSIMSNRTLCIDDAYSTDLVTTSVYIISELYAAAMIIPAGKQKAGEDQTLPNGPDSIPENKMSFVTVREKSGMWSYKTTTKVVKAQMTAEERLNERIKHSRDKHCW
ncbi:hypothetical protein, conserved [Babesia bigemina]|uniref:Uncharacterized protein n=1 Tax=Babesia bigemina TaxID=5866 RepID=A0A061D8Y3_BABBI|nr:hypothetical protein, conserved [Babesia bigemina]CDR95339.1 hypothetical protein, conserved [Babesia bigemina]|eukprot:XP_012767525.1 hypothetical protein, conserved [Babesia bigemina]